jgi:hypothetical protein
MRSNEHIVDEWMAYDEPDPSSEWDGGDVWTFASEASIPVIKAQVVIRKGHPDTIFFTTDFPSPFVNDDKLVIKTEAPHAGGVNYLEEFFPGVPVEVVDIRTKKE